MLAERTARERDQVRARLDDALALPADITALPLLQGIPNVTFLGLGCRLKSALDPCHLMMGAPGASLAAIHQHVKDMAKPIAMLRNARSAGK